MSLRLHSIAGIAAICWASLAGAQTTGFGIDMGTPVEDLDLVRDGFFGFYEIRPPKPHPSLDEYHVLAGPTLGVCTISGEYESTSEALARNSFETLHAQLDEVFGVGKLSEFGKTGTYTTDIVSWEHDNISVKLMLQRPNAGVEGDWQVTLNWMGDNFKDCLKDSSHSEGPNPFK